MSSSSSEEGVQGAESGDTESEEDPVGGEEGEGSRGALESEKEGEKEIEGEGEGEGGVPPALSHGWSTEEDLSFARDLNTLTGMGCHTALVRPATAGCVRSVRRRSRALKPPLGVCTPPGTPLARPQTRAPKGGGLGRGGEVALLGRPPCRPRGRSPARTAFRGGYRRPRGAPGACWAWAWALAAGGGRRGPLAELPSPSPSFRGRASGLTPPPGRQGRTARSPHLAVRGAFAPGAGGHCARGVHGGAGRRGGGEAGVPVPPGHVLALCRVRRGLGRFLCCRLTLRKAAAAAAAQGQAGLGVWEGEGQQPQPAALEQQPQWPARRQRHGQGACAGRPGGGGEPRARQRCAGGAPAPAEGWGQHPLPDQEPDQPGQAGAPVGVPRAPRHPPAPPPQSQAQHQDPHQQQQQQLDPVAEKRRLREEAETLQWLASVPHRRTSPGSTGAASLGLMRGMKRVNQDAAFAWEVSNKKMCTGSSV